MCAALTRRLDELTPRLRAEPADRIVGVAGGVAVMTLDAYLETRIVEQVVHLDDLARSLGRDPWPLPPDAQDLALHIGIDIARLRHHPNVVVHALYRSRLDPVFPVI